MRFHLGQLSKYQWNNTLTLGFSLSGFSIFTYMISLTCYFSSWMGTALMLTMESLSFAKEDNIHLLCLLPYITYFLQPRDRPLFKPVKYIFNHVLGTSIRRHPGRGTMKQTFWKLFAELWRIAATASKESNGCQAYNMYPVSISVYPVNKNILPEAAMAPRSFFFNSHSGGWSPNWVHSARRPLNGLLYPPRVIMMMENLV
jgi:hypothetical protein